MNPFYSAIDVLLFHVLFLEIMNKSYSLLLYIWVLSSLLFCQNLAMGNGVENKRDHEGFGASRRVLKELLLGMYINKNSLHLEIP